MLLYTRQVKATSESSSNCVGCEKSWTEVQADIFSFECEDEGTRCADGSAEAARFGVGGKGTGGLCQWFNWGGTMRDKMGEAIIEKLERAHLSQGV